MNQCTKCNLSLKPAAKFCSACGTAVQPTPQCAKCGTHCEKDAKFCSECGSVVGIDAALFGEFVDDRDGTRYRTVKIDGKIWMAENLNYNGKSVYDWANARNACPNGWHLPSFREWYELLNTNRANKDFYKIFGVCKHDHWWCAEEDSKERSLSWHISHNNGFFYNNSHKLCLLEVRCVKGGAHD